MLPVVVPGKVTVKLVPGVRAVTCGTTVEAVQVTVGVTDAPIEESWVMIGTEVDVTAVVEITTETPVPPGMEKAPLRACPQASVEEPDRAQYAAFELSA